MTIPVQTSSGCPFDCSFYSVTGMFGKAYRFRSTENIIAELHHYSPERHSIFFYDDNFTANRRRTRELLHRMIAENFNFRWSTQVRVDIAKDPEYDAHHAVFKPKRLSLFELQQAQIFSHSKFYSSIEVIRRAPGLNLGSLFTRVTSTGSGSSKTSSS